MVHSEELLSRQSMCTYQHFEELISRMCGTDLSFVEIRK